MGRKIPKRKHKGTRDPEQQRKEREQKLKKAREAPPSAKVEDEPLPRKLKEIMRLRELVKEGKFKEKTPFKRKKPKKELPEGYKDRPLSTAEFLKPEKIKQKGMKRPLKVVPVITQRPGEHDKAFLHRCNVLCDQLIKETNYEDKYKVDIVRNPETGLIEGLKNKEEDEIDKLVKEETQKAKEESKPKKKKMTKTKQAMLAADKEDREILRKNWKKVRQLKRIEKKEEKRERKNGDSLIKHETIKFGDVVERPPEIKVRPRKAIAEKNVKDIMFNQMLIQGKLAEEKNKIESKKSITKGKADGKRALTGKRKDLPAGERRLLESQQKSVIAAYRLMKAKKAKEAKEGTS